ncbi:MORN1 protein, partial [Polyodon spathula]|nr:MORN1 protein [Polyodon spathula]
MWFSKAAIAYSSQPKSCDVIQIGNSNCPCHHFEVRVEGFESGTLWIFIDLEIDFLVSFQGQWRNGLFNGQGSMIHCSGVIYEGMWTNGQPAAGASKIVIEGGDVLEVFRGSPFTVEVQLQNDEGEITADESGRVLKVSAGVRYTELPPSCSSTAFLKLIEDMEEKPFPTPFGFECISYPLMEKMLERDHSRGSDSLAVSKSGFVLTDSPVPEGDVESGSGSDTMGGRGVPPSNLDGEWR